MEDEKKSLYIRIIEKEIRESIENMTIVRGTQSEAYYDGILEGLMRAKYLYEGIE